MLINDKLSAHQAYILALYRHRPELISRMKEITDYYSNKHASAVGTIGNHVMILNTGSIKNVRIGDYCHICGTCRLYNGSVNSNGQRLYISGTALFAIILSYRPVRMWMMEPCLPVAL